jgi:conjugal transfer pilus assembly protein TraA
MQLTKNSYAQTGLLVAAMLFAGTVMAGTGGDQFEEIWITISDLMQGTLGRILIGLMVLAGIGAGVLRQTLMPFITGVGGGIGLYAAPNVIESLMTATLSNAAGIANALQALPVGM